MRIFFGSEWLLFYANSAIILLYHGENKLIVNVMMMRSALFETNTLSWIFTVLAHWNNSTPHSDTLSWFRVNQSLLLFLNAACLAAKQQIPILSSLVWPDRGSNPRSTALEASTLILTSPMWLDCQYREVVTWWGQHVVFWPDRGSNPRSTALEASTLILTSPTWLDCQYREVVTWWGQHVVFWPDRRSNPRSTALEASTLILTMWFIFFGIKCARSLSPNHNSGPSWSWS